MPQNKYFYNKESGNVFVIILVAVALFGALMFTFSRSGTQSTSRLSKNEAKIAAQEILNYARLVEGAVDRVRRNGCSESEISFENAVLVTLYTNAAAPADNSCHIFQAKGGKISVMPYNEKIHANTVAGSWMFFTGSNEVIDIGSGNTELLFVMPIYGPTCDEINKLLRKTITSAIEIFNGSPFQGSFASNGTPFGDENTSIQGHSQACIPVTGGGFIYYKTLLAR